MSNELSLYEFSESEFSHLPEDARLHDMIQAALNDILAGKHCSSINAMVRGAYEMAYFSCPDPLIGHKVFDCILTTSLREHFRVRDVIEERQEFLTDFFSDETDVVLETDATVQLTGEYYVVNVDGTRANHHKPSLEHILDLSTVPPSLYSGVPKYTWEDLVAEHMGPTHSAYTELSHALAPNYFPNPETWSERLQNYAAKLALLHADNICDTCEDLPNWGEFNRGPIEMTVDRALTNLH